MAWTVEDIDWHRFDADAVDPALLAVAKAAALVEANADDYVAYLERVFAEDPEFIAAAQHWGSEECRHGQALARWATLADPDFDFARALAEFRRLYRLPLDVSRSVRGSEARELIARCVVECGTSGLYSALRDAADEPVLRQICHNIASDEFRHYKLFLTHLQRYPRPSPWRRVATAAARVLEIGDDELAAAWHAANGQGNYRRNAAGRAFRRHVVPFYRPLHVGRMVKMTFAAAGLNAQGRLSRIGQWLAWHALQFYGGRPAI